MDQIKHQHGDLPISKNTYHFGIVIGAVVDKAGNCVMACFDYRSQELLVTVDNVHDIKFENIGHINLDLHQIKLECDCLTFTSYGRQ
jgi:hypothetical protein